MGTRSKTKAEQKDEIDKILARVDRLPVLDSRTADEILGYDENGLPQSEDSKRASEPTPLNTPRLLSGPPSPPARRRYSATES